MIAVLLLVALAGYALGRLQPGRRASDWAHWLMVGTPATRREWRWWAAQPVFAVEIMWLLTCHPVRTVHAWRHRKDPPPPLGPPVRVRRMTGGAA